MPGLTQLLLENSEVSDSSEADSASEPKDAKPVDDENEPVDTGDLVEELTNDTVLALLD